MKLILEVEDAKQALFELTEIMIKLRYYTKEWEEHFGSGPKNRKKFWEQKADEWCAAKTKENKE